MDTYIFPTEQGNKSILHCFVLSLTYVGSLYITKSPFHRDHPQTIKQRMRNVLIVCMFAPFYVSFCCVKNDLNGNMLNVWFGIHANHFLKAMFVPLFLTSLLFFGPMVLCIVQQHGFKNTMDNIVQEIKSCDLNFYRTYIVAPFTEEFVFRSCLLPLLVPNFGLNKSILISPLFFGVAHLHHVMEKLKLGAPIFEVLLTSLFQMFYTTIFGSYSAFLFLRTGHLVAPVICHSFCNMMGFPEFQYISTCQYPKLVLVSFICGLILFLCLLYPLTEPSLYGGTIYQKY